MSYRFLYSTTSFPKTDAPTLTRVDDAAQRLHDKLKRLDVSRCGLSDYATAYLERYRKKLFSNLQRLAHVILQGALRSARPLEQLTLVDYGGGIGLVSMMAVETGIPHVLYNDIYEPSCVDARRLGESLGCTPHSFVCGDIGAVRTFLEKNRLEVDLLISTDVIEHIYRIENFFDDLNSLPASALAVSLSTHANPMNPVIARSLMKSQRQVEETDREETFGHKKRDELRAYRRIREEIIRKCGDGRLDPSSVETLVERTRGLAEADIRRVVGDFLQNGHLPPLPRHPTNTCDPLTGNWADRLESPFILKHQLEQRRFEVTLIPGRYGKPNGSAKHLTAIFLDRIIRLLGAHGVRLSNSFILAGRKSG